jgi:hypothetical protein
VAVYQDDVRVVEVFGDGKPIALFYADGEPTLLTYDEVTVLFHEFGHALHGLFSNVKYPRFAGTSAHCGRTLDLGAGRALRHGSSNPSLNSVAEKGTTSPNAVPDGLDAIAHT